MTSTAKPVRSTIESSQGPAAASYWQARWRDGRTGWDQGRVHPLFDELIAAGEVAGLARGARILEPGCGRAHAGAALAKAGYDVTAVDVSPLAVAGAKELYGNVRNLRVMEMDMFRPATDLIGTFDAIYDRAVLCALPKHARPGYVQSCVALLKPGGLFMSLPFSKLHISENDGPPFAVSAEHFIELFEKDFEKVSMKEVPHTEPDSKIAVEMIAVWRKR